MQPCNDRPPRLARGILSAALALASAVATPCPAADKTRDDVIKEIALLVSETVKAQGQTTLSVSGFNNPFDKKKSAGAGIRAVLIKQLKDLNINVEDTATLALMGSFRVSFATAKGEKIPVEQIDYELKTESGKVLLTSNTQARENSGEKPAYDKDPAGITDAAGASVEVTPSKPKEANQKIITAIANDAKTSTVVVEGTKIRPEKGSKFALEILTAKSDSPGRSPSKDSYKPTIPVVRDGVVYVTLAKDDYYAVNVCNEHDFNIAVALSIDGIDMFQFSEEKAERTKFWIYKPDQAHALFGWHRKGNRFDSFLVGEYSKDSAGKEVVDDESKLSQISAEFRAAWPDASKMPADEGAISSDGDKGLPKTLRGPEIEDENETVQSFIGKFRGRVTVRYDHDYPDLPK